MSNKLGLQKESTLDYIHEETERLFVEHDVHFIVDDGLSITKALTGEDDRNCASIVRIGVFEIYHAKRNFPYLKSSVVQDEDFAKVILNMYHEEMHVIQKNEIFRKQNLSEFEQNQLMQEIACMYSRDYYMNGSNYCFNANEIQAEQYGIESTYDYLCNTFPDISTDQIENIIVNVVNQKAQMSYFIENKTYTSLNEILSAFDDAYDRSFTQTRDYRVNISLADTDDPVRKYILSNPDEKTAYLDCLSGEKETYALKQDRYVASICMKLYPEIVNYYPVLQTDASGKYIDRLNSAEQILENIQSSDDKDISTYSL